MQELKQLMALHGGKFANYYYKTVVTHVICDHLPDTKLKQLLKSKSATPIVRAAWVVESIAAGKLLPPAQFSIDRLNIGHAQQRLCSAPERQQAELGAGDVYPQLEQPRTTDAETARAPEHGAAAPEDAGTVPGLEHGPRCQRQRSVHQAGGDPTAVWEDAEPGSTHNELAVSATERLAEEAVQLPDCTLGQHAAAAHDSRGPDGLRAAAVAPQSSAEPPSADAVQPHKPVHMATSWDPAQIRAAQRTAAAMRDACDVLKMPPRSSADDPNFMQTYFRASRLHFIGTWKMRIEALMAEKAGASQIKGPAGQATAAAQALFAGPQPKRQKKDRCTAGARSLCKDILLLLGVCVLVAKHPTLGHC